MNIDLETRRKQLKNLNEFITDARKKILDVTKELQWDIRTLDHKKEMVCCPFDDGHVIPKTSLESHVERCKFKKQGYHPEDIPLPPLSVDLNASSVLKVDKELQASILRQAKEKNPAMLIGFPGAFDDRDVPLTSDRFMSSLTSDEKAAIHSYVVSNTVSLSEGKDISLLEQDLEKNFKNKKEEKRDKTPLEKLIEERDAKRRKEGKKVHINRKSHTEIIREVIENQMEVYVEWLKDENIIKREEVDPAQLEASSNQSEGEIIEPDVKQEYDTSCHFSGNIKSFVSDDRKQRSREPGDRQRSHQRREFNEYSDSGRQKDLPKGRESRSRFHHSRDSGSKRYWDSESTSYRDNERRNYKEYDYKKFSGKYSVDEKGDYGRLKAKKHGSENYWAGGAHVVKEYTSSGEEDERERRTRKRHEEKMDSGKKQEKEKKHHKSRRRRHSSSSDSDRTKYKKEDHRRND